MSGQTGATPTFEPYVKPFVKRGKTDGADAEANCGEARPWPRCGRESAPNVTRPTMRFVPVKAAEGQAALLDHVAPQVSLRRHARAVLMPTEDYCNSNHTTA